MHALKGLRVELYQFRDLIGPPNALGDPARDWVRVEGEFGVILPVDYKGFISAYGSGEFMGTLLLFHPAGRMGDEGLNLFDLWRSVASTYAYLASSGSFVPPLPVHPDSGGAVPVGRSILGNVLFLVPPRPGEGLWTVAIDAGEWISFEVGFTDFLWEALQGDLHPILDGDPGFERIGALDV